MFVESGMIGEIFSIVKKRTSDAALTERMQSPVEAIGDAAVLASARILRAISPESFNKLNNEL